VTRPTLSPLVLDGDQIKLRLIAERTDSKTPVHVDWVRFTTLLRNAPLASAELLFPKTDNIWDPVNRQAELVKTLSQIPDPDYSASVQAYELAQEVCEALGESYTVNPEIRKGHDFYRCRWSIERNGSEVGWVGFLSSSESPRQVAQAQTLHCNLYGAACTFADRDWNHRLADLIELHDGKLTRADLALDFFDGLPEGRDMENIRQDYMDGLMDSGGKRLKCSQAGDWCNGAERSFYLGSREAGKQTNIYEKGDQLYGAPAHSPWVRIELRYGNKLRFLSVDMLRRPADFFAGASDWHAAMLRQADQVVVPEPVKTTPRLAIQTIEAEVARNVRWALSVAAPTITAAFQHLGDEFLQLCTNHKLPGRLQRFAPSELQRVFRQAFETVSTVEGKSPAFA
jgi:phage replication initiation protein